MKLPVVLASLFAATSAYAQAPGEYEGGTAAPGTVAPQTVAPTPVPKLRRWSVGLGIGSLGLSPHEAPDVKSEYGIGQLAVRYLATRHLEIELAFAGGREQLEDGNEGDHEVSQGVLALRYRFSPTHHWNWWLMAGLGSLAVTHTEASDDEREAAQQSTLQFGVGLEHRWERFALQLELRAVGVKAHDAPDETKPVPGDVMTDWDEMVPPPATGATDAGDGMAGGQVIISGNYYF